MTTFEQYGVPAQPIRKASGGVVALGVINIIYGTLFRLCCGTFALVMSLFMDAVATFLESMPEMDSSQMAPFEMMKSGPMQAYSMINGFVMLMLGVLLLIGGIGLLKLRPWGRTLSLGVATGEIVWVVMSFAINVFFVYPRMSQMMGEELAEAPQMVGNVIYGIFSSSISLVYPVVLLICLNLESIKKQFQSPTTTGF